MEKEIMRNTVKQTHLITPNELLNEYRVNEKLRKFIDIGCFVYAEEMLIINDPRYVIYKNGQPLLADFDREDLPKCALNFNVINLSFQSKEDYFGDKNILQDKSLAANENLEIQNNYDFLNRQKKVYSFINSIQGLNCWDMIGRFLKFVKQEEIIYNADDIGTDSDIFCNRTNLGEHYYKRLIGTMKRKEKIQKNAIIAFAAGYELYADMAEVFLKANGDSLSLVIHDEVCYRLVLNTMTQSPITVKNAALEKYGAKKLGTQNT